MTPLSPARRAAEEFASVVDGSRRGDVAERYADLVACVDELRGQEIPAPRADFVADLRMRLMDAADELLLPAGAEPAPVIALPTPAARRQRRVSIAAAAFVVIGGSAGVAAAAENALPGDPLYPIKRGIESAQVSLNASDSGKGQDLLRNAATRLEETERLISDKKSSATITSTLSTYRDTVSDGADKLFVSFQRNGDAKDITRLRTMLSTQLTKLDALSAEAPASTQPAFTAARQLIADLDQQASVLCASCGPQTIAEAFANTSAPALSSLFTVPAPKPATSNPGKGASSLANRAGDLVKNGGGTQHPGATETPAATDEPTKGPLDGTPVERPARGLGATVNGLTSGVSSLLQGGSLSETLETTLESLTKLLP
jgi:hypothetical protein